ncbi:MAG: beta strand repeat-containing protein, partial [Blastocatellia bacterium]
MTVTTTTPHNFLAGQSVVVSGVGVAGYNGTFTIGSTPTPTTFTYTDGTTGLAGSGGGTATVTESTMPLNGIVTLRFILTNPNPTALSGVAFTDTLPSGLQVAATPNASSPCGTFTPSAGNTSLTFSGGSLAGSATCIVSVDITATTVGVKNNTTGAVTSTEGGTGTTANASITVLAPPSISKAFGAANISPGGTTTLTFTITNSNPANQLLGVAFTDALPSGLQVAATPGASTSCGGTFAPNPGDTTLTFSGGTVAAAGTCTIVVNVTGTTGGVKNNTTGNVTSANAGTGNTATASITVASPPTLTKAFGVSMIPVGGTTSLTFTITNPNAAISLTNIAFTDTLPAGLSVPSGTTSTCSGTLTTTAPSTISFSGGTLAGSGTCSFGVTVTGIAAGVQNNTTGAISSTESGTGATSNTATLTVVGPPTIAKEFISTQAIAASPTGATESGSTVTITTTAAHGFVTGETVVIAGVGVAGYNGTFTIASVPTTTTFTYTDGTSGLASSGGGTATATLTSMQLNGIATLRFTITNPNTTTTLTGVAFTDALPAGLQVAATPNAVPGCGTFTPAAGDTTLTFTAGTIAASGTCTVSVDVTGTTPGVKNNTTSAITSTEGGTG